MVNYVDVIVVVVVVVVVFVFAVVAFLVTIWLHCRLL